MVHAYLIERELIKGRVRLNLTAQGYYAQLIAQFQQNVIDILKPLLEPQAR